MTRFLGIDQGTTATKGCIVEADGQSRVLSGPRHRQFHPAPGAVEHDPEELLAAIRSVLHAAGPVDGVGLAHQGETVIAFDAATGRAIHPAIVWLDTRTEAAVARMRAAGYGAAVQARAGLPLESYFAAPRLAWLFDQVPEARRLYAEGRLRLGTSDAFFLFRLTGRFVTDRSAASRTSLMNLGTGEWDDALCAIFGVPRATLPEILPSAGRLGAIDGVPVFASAVDQQAALYGHGCRAPGEVKITFGTGAFALALTGERAVREPQSGLVPTVAWETDAGRTYALDGGIYNAASAVDWARDLGLFSDWREIDAFDGASAIARGIAFVPALSGLACPHWDRAAAGLFIGMDLATTRHDLARAVLEGVALRAAELVDAFGRHIAAAPALRIDGGLARNGYFCRFLAAASGRRIDRLEAGATALGAALLARRGAGLDPEIAAVPPVTRFSAAALDPALRERFADAVSRAKAWHRPAAEPTARAVSGAAAAG